MSQASTRAQTLALGGSCCLFVALCVTHAWVVDDAFITFRTVDNFVNGHGLRWNVDERVQVYTHPLWMFLCSAVYAFTHEVYYTAIGLCFVVSLLALAVSVRGVVKQAGAGSAALMLALIMGSKAFMDFTSSGLENPLTHLLLGAFFVRFLFAPTPWARAPASHVLVLYLIAALGFVNRQDTLVFFLPACALVFLTQLREKKLAALWPALLGFLPAVAWLSFSLFYYGSAVPNTGYAKLISVGLTRSERLQLGLGFFADSLARDPLTLPLCALAVGVSTVHALRTRTLASLCAAGGLLAYLAYVLLDGAAGTHMSGRFFSGPALLAALLVATLSQPGRGRAALFVVAAAVWILAPRSPLRVATPFYDHAVLRGAHVIDTRDYAQREGTSIVTPLATLRRPSHPAFQAGEAFRGSSSRVSIGGPGKRFAAMVGFSGYAAGPRKHIIDVLGLTDPLLARLPIAKATKYRPGHFFRALPVGYLASVQHRDNRIVDKDLKQFYDVILLVTRGPLWSQKRLLTIWRLHTGAYEHYVQAYAKRVHLRVAGP